MAGGGEDLGPLDFVGQQIHPRDPHAAGVDRLNEGVASVEPAHLRAFGGELALGDPFAVERAEKLDPLGPTVQEHHQRFVPRARVDRRRIGPPPQETSGERVVGRQASAIETADRAGLHGHDLRRRPPEMIDHRAAVGKQSGDAAAHRQRNLARRHFLGRQEVDVPEEPGVGLAAVVERSHAVKIAAVLHDQQLPDSPAAMDRLKPAKGRRVDGQSQVPRRGSRLSLEAERFAFAIEGHVHPLEEAAGGALHRQRIEVGSGAGVVFDLSLGPLGRPRIGQRPIDLGRQAAIFPHAANEVEAGSTRRQIARRQSHRAGDGSSRQPACVRPAKSKARPACARLRRRACGPGATLLPKA